MNEAGEARGLQSAGPKSPAQSRMFRCGPDSPFQQELPGLRHPHAIKALWIIGCACVRKLEYTRSHLHRVANQDPLAEGRCHIGSREHLMRKTAGPAEAQLKRAV